MKSDYCIETETSIVDLTNSVNKKLAQGYKPVGGLVITESQMYHGLRTYMQVLVKETTEQ